MPEEIYKPRGSSQFESTTKRSRFISIAQPVSTPREAKKILSELREKYSDATHIVYAFRVGGTVREEYGMSDDGEPKGTAGKPVLEVLKGSGITDVLLAVIRYYGGTKLGTGGLVKAYTEAAQGALRELVVDTYQHEIVCRVQLPYHLHDVIRRVFMEHQVEVVDETYGTDIEIVVRVNEETRHSLEESLRDISRGSVCLECSEAWGS
jgi:uncharacterized YigZ family protein